MTLSVAPDPGRLEAPEPALYARDELLHEMFAEVTARYGYRPALRMLAPDAELDRRPAWTYRALRERAARFANYLREIGVQRGDRVVICLPRSLDQYMAILGVLEAGAAYVPVDWSFPQERADFIVGDCEARAVVTLQERAAAFAAPVVIALDAQLSDIAAAPARNLPRSLTGAEPEDLAYILYTSGSTGQPKGVMIRHSNICHLVRSEGSVLGVTSEDRVFGAFSLAFDMSVETMWSAFFAGAELLVASEAMAAPGPALAEVLAEARVTVWHAVPSLLAAIDQDVPSARLINLGGEALPPDLARRWSRPSRRLLNTYGPTETTVTATWAEIAPDGPVTIGKALPGYRLWIVDEQLQPVCLGSEGELLIGGPGVGAGYLNRPDLTAQAFVRIGFNGPDLGERAYRSGDLVRLNRDGDLEFLGRIDTQVKIRGYRVELGEIEAVLTEHPTVGQAAVKLFSEEDGSDLLIAFVTARAGGQVDLEGVKASLRDQLPAYMRPAHIEAIGVLPTLVSGKVDRNALRLPDFQRDRPPPEPPATPLEAQLAEIWNTVFFPRAVGVGEDFFEALGGHSLKAARMVSIARLQPALSGLSIGDLYAAPTIRALAQRLERQPGRDAEPPPPFAPIKPWRRIACVAGQTAALPLIYAFGGLQWLTPYLAYTWLASNEVPRLTALLIAAPTVVVMPPLIILLAVALKWIVLGRARAGDYPLWGGYFFRWWLVRRLLEIVPTRFLAGTPLMALYMRLLGAKIGADAFLGIGDLDAPDMIEIGAGALLSEECVLSATSVERGLFRLGPVKIGAGAVLGVGAVAGRGCSIGDGARLGDLSAIPPGESIPAGESWDGSPALRRGPAPPRKAPTAPSPLRRRLISWALGAAACLLPVVVVTPVAPGLLAMVEIDWRTRDYAYLAASPLLALTYVVLMCLLTVGAKWLLLGRVKPGLYSIWSGFYVRFWFVRQLGEMALDLLHPIYATLYVRPWYRAFGAKVGARAEISTATSVVHDLVEIGSESFIADGVVFGGARLEPGAVRLAATRIGRRSFVGNSGLLPAGADVGDDVLIGVLSKPPPDGGALEPGSTWFGSPPIRLPHRQTVALFDEGATFRPARRLVAARLLIEYVRVTLSLTVFVALFGVMLSILGDLADGPRGLVRMALAFPLLYLGFCASAGAFVIVLKWLVIGRYRPIVRPLWSLFVWRTELVTSTYENLAAPLLLQPLRGTPFLNIYLRLMGCRIGRRAFIDTTDITEFDLVSIGDDAALNDAAGLQTHLFEDRVMKVSTVEIGDRAVVGSRAIVLYDAVIEADAQLGDLSVLMKGERLPAGTCWEGSPAQPARGAA